MSNLSVKESPTIAMEQACSHLAENPPLESGHTMENQIVLPSIQIGETELVKPSQNIDQNLTQQNEINSATTSSNRLKSHADPQKIQLDPVKPRVLQVSKHDIDTLCQIIAEYHEQFLQ